LAHGVTEIVTAGRRRRLAARLSLARGSQYLYPDNWNVTVT
jgi:hypothetical protein